MKAISVRVLCVVLLLLFLATTLSAQVSLTTLNVNHNQEFDTLPASGSATWTNNSTIPGWFHARTGTGTTIVANDGSSNAGNLYSYGTGTNTDRALGSLGSGNAAIGNLFWGVRLQNNTGATITSLDVSYVGEQWRNSAAAAQTIAFSYLVGSPTVTGSLAEFQSAGTAVPALDFTTPITGGVAGALNGNLAANRVALSTTITGLSIPNGTEIMLRWSDPDHTGADHGISIDSFNVTPHGGPVLPTLNINDVSQLEGNASTSTFNFTVSLSAPAGPGGVTFDIATADGTATTADNDYANKSQLAQTIPAGSSTYSFNVTVNGDVNLEPNETFFVNVTNITGATAGDTQGQGTIQTDDVPPNLTINDVTLSEGNAATTTFTFTVSLSAPAPPGGVTFDIATADGTGTTADNDYVAKSLLAQTIAAGNTTYTFDVLVNGDTAFEGNDTFFVNVTNVTGATLTDGQGLGTINNDEAVPQLSINDVSLTEGNAGTQVMTFTVTMSAAAGANVTVDYTTADSSATDADNDYEVASGTLTFVPGDTTESISVTVNGDTNIEGDEQFLVNLSNVTGGATISDNQGLGIIKLDDAFSIAAVDTAYTTNFDVMASTGTFAATTPAAFTFVETGTAANATYSINDGASNSGNTYSYGTTAASDRALGGLQSGSLIPTLGAFFVNNTGVPITTLSIQYRGEEWRLGTASRADRLDFQYSTDATNLSSGTWTDVDPLDFSTPNQTTTGAKVGNNAGNFTNISHTITGLSIPNGATFWIRWNDLNASGADDGLAVDDFSILANISAGIASIDDQSVTEGAAGTQVMNFTVTLSQPAGASGVTFDIATQDGSATTADNDYVANSVIGATIPAGNTTYTFPVTVNGDANPEPTEQFFVNVTNLVGAIPGDVQGTGAIVSDDITLTMIHDIQGNGLQSPIPGNTVNIRGVVTGVKSGGSGGFFVQEEEADYDADPNTSEGVFVFTSGVIPSAAVIGNIVDVTGTVQEFPASANPHTVTELSGTVTTSLVSTGNPLPAPHVLTVVEGSPTTNVSQYEPWEGMRVTAPSFTVVAPTQGSKNESAATSTSTGVFYAVVTGVPRPFREIGIEQTAIIPSEAPCPACIDKWDMNPERLRVDSDNQPGATQLNVAAGQTITNMVGPLDFGFFEYTILPEPASVPIVAGPSTFVAAPTPTATELTVAGYNLERFYDTVDDPESDVALTPAALAMRLNKASLAIRNALKTPDVVGVVEVENLSVLQQLAAKINTDTGNVTNYVAYLQEGNDVGGIDVGFLVNENRVTTNSVTQFGKTATFIDPSDSSVDTLNDRPPLVLEAQIARPDSSIYEFTVIVNHLRSLNGIETDDAAGQRIRAKRAAQAEYLADLVQQRQTTDPTERILLVGDFNAFEFHDGYVDMIGTIKGDPAPANEVVVGTDDLVDPNLTDLIESLPAAARYSYSFSGSAQVIDHAIVNAAMLPSVSRFAFAHVDADYPDSFRGDSSRPERISDHDATVTYLELAAPSGISINDVSQPEGNAANTMTFTVTLDAPQSQNVTVNYTTNPGTATAGSDYTTTSGTLTFVPGDQSETIVVPILGDAIWEADETFTVTLSTPSANATITDGSGTGTIQNDDPLRQISIADASVAEGDSGTTQMTFVVTLDAPPTSTVTVNYNTSDGSASSASDYAAASGTVTFNVGDASENIVINVNGDTTLEPDETFTITLSQPSQNAVIDDSLAIGTIVNDEGIYVASINDVSLSEGNAGTTPFTFTVTLNAPPTSTVTVDYATSNGTANAGSDYTAATGTVTFVAGDASENVTINVAGDTSFEPNETFFVTLSNPSVNATIADGTGQGTIQNDDGPQADLVITKTASDTTPQAGDQITFTIVVTNNGPDTATGVTVTDDLPAGMDFVSANSTIGTCNSSDPVVCTVGTLNNGQSATITLTVLLSGAPGSYSNTAVADSNETDANGATGAAPIVVSPANINGIPTLSEWALLGLMTMLAAIAALKLR